MNTRQFDPMATPEPPKNEEFDSVTALQKEELRLKEIGDANEAAGLNRDGTPKEPVNTAPTGLAAGGAVSTAPKAVSVSEKKNEIRDLKIPHMKDAPLGGGGLTDEALFVKEKLAKEPRLPFYVPLDQGEKKGVAYRSVTINGYRCEVKKGMLVEVPKSIYNILVDSYNAEAEAVDRPENMDVENPLRDAALNPKPQG